MRVGIVTTTVDPRVVAAVEEITRRRSIVGIVHTDADGLGSRVRSFPPGAPVVHVRPPSLRPLDDDAWRRNFEARIALALDSWACDVVLLLGYPWIVRHALLARRAVNVHPALPSGPVGSERAVITQLARSGARATGVRAHVVVEELDAGPPIAFASAELPRRDPGWLGRGRWMSDVAALHGRLVVPVTLAALDAIESMHGAELDAWPAVPDRWPADVTYELRMPVVDGWRPSTRSVAATGRP